MIFFLQIFGACPTNRWGGVQQDKFPGSKNREIFIYHNYTTVASSRTLNGTDIPYKSHHSFKTRCITINSNQPLLTASHWQKLLLIISAHGFFFAIYICNILYFHFILSQLILLAIKVDDVLCSGTIWIALLLHAQNL